MSTKQKNQQNEMKEFHDLIETTSCYCRGNKKPSLEVLAKKAGITMEVILGPEDEICICFSDHLISHREPGLLRASKRRD
jgi:hypothetical protein